MATRFIPTDHSELEYWFEAWKLTGYNDTDVITAANDQSPYGRDGTVAGSPTYHTNQLNGRPVVRLNGTSQRIDVDAIASAFSGSDKPFTAYMVAKVLSTAHFKYFWALGSSSSDNPYHGFRSKTNTGFDSFRSDDVPATGAISPTSSNYDTEWHVHTMVFSGTSCTLRMDGAQEGTGSQDLGAMTVDQFSIGALPRTSYGSYINIDLAAFLIFSDAHTAAEQIEVETYLNNRYQVYSGFATPNTLIDTSTDIVPFHLKYSTVLSANAADITPDVGMFLGAYPDLGKADDDTTQTHALLESYSATMPILMYMQSSGEPPGSSFNRIPWGAGPDTFRNEYWREVNRYEDCFFHTADPAGLTTVLGDTTVDLYWMADRRTVVDGLNPTTYNVQRATVSGGPYTELASAQAGRSYNDTSLTNGTTYYYLIESVDGNYTYTYSNETSAVPTATPPAIQVYDVNFSIAFDANESNDAFHPLPGKTVDYTFTAKSTGTPSAVNLYITGEDYADGYTANAMTDTAGTYSVDIQKAITSSYAGGFAFYVDSDSTLSPADHGYTTNMNNRIRSATWGFYRSDSGSAQLQEFHSRWMAMWVDYGYDGLFYDLTGTPEMIDTDEIPPLGYHQDAAGFTTQWETDKKAHVEYVKNNEPDALVVVNHRRGYDKDADYRGTVDGILIESFCQFGNGAYIPEAQWKLQINEMLDTGDSVILCDALGLLAGNENYDISDRMYCLASYLLGKGRESYIGLFAIAEINYVAEYDLPIGEPTETYSDVSDYLVSDVYVRNFANGRVYVNPSATVTSETISLEKGFVQYEPVGGTVLSGTSGFTETPVVSIQLAPHTGVVLLRRPSGASGTSRKKVLAISLEIEGYVTIESENGESM